MNIWDALRAGGVTGAKSRTDALEVLLADDAAAIIAERKAWHKEQAEIQRIGAQKAAEKAAKRKAREAAAMELARRDVDMVMRRYDGVDSAYGYDNVYGQRVTAWFYQ